MVECFAMLQPQARYVKKKKHNISLKGGEGIHVHYSLVKIITAFLL